MLFGKPKNIVDPAKTLADLNAQSASLEKQMQFKYSKAAEYKNQAAVHYNNKQNSRAVTALKMCKTMEFQAESLSKQIFTIEQLKMQLDQANVMKPTIQVIKSAKTTMQNMLKDMDVGDVEDLMHDMNVNLEDMDDISKALSNPLEGSNVFDDEQLLGELSDMKSESMEKELYELEEPPSKVPSGMRVKENKRQQQETEAIEEFDFDAGGNAPEQRKSAPIKERPKPVKTNAKKKEEVDEYAELAEQLYF